MDILFVVPYAPNLVRTRPYNLIRYLTERGNRVTVLTLWTNEREQEALVELEKLAHRVWALPMPLWRSLWNCVFALPGGQPLQSVYSWQPELLSFLNGDVHFDVVHVEHLRGSRYALRLKELGRWPVVWDSVDCISHLFRQAAVRSENLIGRWRSRFELKRTERYEGWLLNQFDRVLVTSSVDKRALASLSDNGDAHSAPQRIAVLPNGVDVDYFSPDTAVSREENTVIVSGKMSYHANVTMTLYLANDIMPHVWARQPDVKLWIVGKDPARELRALEENTAVTVTGTVPDLRDYLRRAAVAATPIPYGAGIQNKVLEAMACATPVVTTPQATAALDIQPGRDLLVAEEPQAFAAALLNLLDDPQRRRQLGQAGRDYVEDRHHWNNIAARLETIYRETIHTRQAVLN
ncbi:MAG: glycosyltransferase [Chloroflexi bacterium]|nr:glycosyltransferase [Chloroflexota bacterium]